MRLVYLCADPGIPLLGGKGASVHVRSVVAALGAAGHEVTLVVRSTGSGNPPPPAQRTVVLGEDPASHAGEVAEAVAAAGAEAVIERYSLASGPGRQASTAAGVPLVLEVDAPLVLEAARHRGLGDVERWLAWEREVLATADAVGTVSSALAGYVSGVAPAQRVRWIPNGVDAGAFDGAAPADLGLPPGAVAVGFAGSMKAWHGVGDLVEAMGRPAVPASAHLVLAGTGPEAAAIAARVEASPLAARTVVLGQVAHARVPAVLAALDVGVAPYVAQDDFYFSPLKVLEYLAAGVPAVCPAVGDLPALVGGAGLLYPAGDVDALAGAVGALVADGAARRRCSAEGRRRAGELSWAANARSYADLAAEAAAARSGVAP